MKPILASVLADRGSRWLWVSSLVFNLGQWIGVLVLAPKNQQFVPLHYTIYFGIDLTGTWRSLFWVPGIGLIIQAIHSFGALLVPEKIWHRSWLVFALFLQVLLTLGLVALLLTIRQSE